MAYMQWKPEMSVGMEELDEDHRFLIKVINRLAENSAGDGNAEAVGECLASLRNYAEFHFAREEGVMRACGYSTLSEHQDEHRAFTRSNRRRGPQFREGRVGRRHGGQ
jgi:hemerythrin-like metal-binding protein